MLESNMLKMVCEIKKKAYEDVRHLPTHDQIKAILEWSHAAAKQVADTQSKGKQESDIKQGS